MKEKILELRRNGLSFKQISKELSCSTSTISYHCKKSNMSDIGLNDIKRKERGSKICEGCGEEFSLVGKNKKRRFCNKECYIKSDYLKELGRSFGINSSQLQGNIRRSKNEIYFFELCSNYFNKVKNNENIFNGWDADVIIEDIKVAVLWNGIWHYEKVTKKHSVEQVKNRDEIKIKEIIKCGYKPYIIKDMGRENKKFVESEFSKFLINYCSVA
jgi:predicted DNA-binding protein YlxM (UPF0122 family)